MTKANKKPILLVIWLVLLGGLMYGVTHLGSGGNSETAPPNMPPPPSLQKVAQRWSEIVAHAAAPARGDAAAHYTMAEFGDFQCPQCGKARPLLERLLAKYPTDVNLIFVHCPFPNIHKWALPTAQASEIAAAQGKFWQMYDMLYSHQDDLEPGFYGDYAAKIGMNKAHFNAAFAAKQGAQTVSDDMAFDSSIGVQETPTVLLHDNKTGKVTIYVGLTGSNDKKTLGIKSLAADPPWTHPSGIAAAKD